MIEQIKYIKDKIKLYDSEIDTSDSTPLVGLFVNPIASILFPFKEDHDDAIKIASLLDPSTISEDDVDMLAANFSVTRTVGAKATGNVYLYFKTARTLNLGPEVWFVSTAGKKYFLTNSSYSIDQETMRANIDKYPKFGTGPIAVTAELEGVDYDIAPGQIKSIQGTPIVPDIVTNLVAISGGEAKETNQQMVDKIDNAIINGSIYSENGIKSSLITNFSTIKDISVIGAGDDEMTRDLVYTISGDTVLSTLRDGYNLSDLYGSISGYPTAPHNRSRGYWGIFYAATVSGEDIGLDDIPSPSSFAFEFTNDEYSYVYKKNDLTYTTVATKTMLRQDFTGKLADSKWVMGDGATIDGTVLNPFEVEVIEGAVRLGKTAGFTDNVADDGTFSVSVSDLEYLQDILDNLEARDPGAPGRDNPGGRGSRRLDGQGFTEGDVAKLKALLLDNPKLNSFNPVYHIPISKNKGIEISGTMKTTDITTNGSMSYVTVGRQNSASGPSEGLGFAWRKSSDATVGGDLPAGNVLPYNIYIVDNSFLNEDTFIQNGNLIVDGGLNNSIGGTNTLTYGRREILVDTTYKYVMRISDNMEITIWILDNTQDIDLIEDTPYGADPYDADVDPTNDYGWVARKSSTDPVYTPNATGTDFGFGVISTSNRAWHYSDIIISTTEEDYPGTLFKLDAPEVDFETESTFRVVWKGFGNWTGREEADDGARVYVYNVTDGAWELVGTNSANLDSIESYKIIQGNFTPVEDYRDGDNYINVLSISDRADVSATINSEYAAIDNIAPSGVHTGGVVDIYVNDPDNVTIGTATVLNSTGSISLNSTNGFTLPIHEVLSVAVDGVDIERNVDYEVVVSSSALAFSTDPSLSITFQDVWTPSTVVVSYSYPSTASNITAYLESSSFKNPGSDAILKIKPPVVISIPTMKYRGTIAAPALQAEIVDWVNDLTTSFSISDFITFLYSKKVTYINLTSLDIVYRSYDYLGEQEELDVSITDTLALGTLQAFYTSLTELYGVEKIG